jgi:hypothetical protein
MKNIIFEVINTLILNGDSALTFDSHVISKIVEISNIYGMSIKKFKRILGILVTDFFLYNEFFYIHQVDIGLHSYTEFSNQLHGPLHRSLQDNLNKYHGNQETLEESLQFLMQEKLQPLEAIEKFKEQIKQFSKKKRQWLKAFEVLQDIVRATQG